MTGNKACKLVQKYIPGHNHMKKFVYIYIDVFLVCIDDFLYCRSRYWSDHDANSLEVKLPFRNFHKLVK